MSTGLSVRYLTVDEVRAIHQRLVERYGGHAELRDAGLLDSAVYRPRTGHYSDLAALAAALLEALALLRPCKSGNLRLAFFAADVFLRLNGWRVALDNASAAQHLSALAARDELDLVHLEAWLRPALLALR